MRDLEVALEALIAEQRNADSEIEKHRDQHSDLNERFNQVQARFYSLGADISRIEQVLQFNRDRQRQLHDDIEQTENAWQEAQSHLARRNNAELAAGLGAVQSAGSGTAPTSRSRAVAYPAHGAIH